jgi:hypothetical protein
LADRKGRSKQNNSADGSNQAFTSEREERNRLRKIAAPNPAAPSINADDAGSGVATATPVAKSWPSVVPNWKVAAVTVVSDVTPPAAKVHVAD